MADSHREEIAKLESLYAGNPGGRVFVHLAEAYRKAGEHERARRILDEGLARHPDSASGYVVLGRVLADMQITAEAEIAFRRVLELDGGNLIALRWLGDLARQSGRNHEAALHYRELLIRNPSNEEVRDLVEIVEREAEGDMASRPAASGAEDGDTDAFSGLVLDTESDEPRETPAVAAPISESEEPAVTSPAQAPDDITPWSAAPGQTGDAEEPRVEYGLVDLDTGAADPDESAGTDATPADETEAALAEYDSSVSGGGTERIEGEYPGRPPLEPQHAEPDDQSSTSAEGAGEWSVAHAGDESDLVASTEDDDAAFVEVDDLRRVDEAEPVEIHLLDPSYEPSAADEDEYVEELDLSDLADTGSLPEADDYADDSFIADLSGAGEETPPADALPVAVDVMDAALTLIPDDGEGESAATDPETLAASQPASADASLGTAAEDDQAQGLSVTEVEQEWKETDADAGVTDAVGYTGTLDVEAGITAPGENGEPEPAELEAADLDLAEPEPAELEFAEQDAGEDDTAEPEPRELGAEELESAEEEVENLEPAAAISDFLPSDSFDRSVDDALDSGGTHLMELAGAAEPATESNPVAEVRRGSEPGLVTETMAVLYRSQGFHDRAADVYRALLRSRPGDERLAAKLREAEEAAGWTAGRSIPAQEDEAGEVWLRGVGAAWTAPADTTPEEATPYAWTGEADDVESGEAISSYLHDLVSWKAGSQGPWTQPEPESDTEEPGEIEMPDWLNGPAETAAWTPDSEPVDFSQAGAKEQAWTESEPVEYESPGAAESDWAPSEPTELAPWERSPAEPDESAAPADAGALSSDAEPVHGWGLPDDSEPAAAAGETAAAEPDAGAGWTPLELENDLPPAAASSNVETADLPPMASPEDDSSEDEDLEMFRSWLQSLRK